MSYIAQIGGTHYQAGVQHWDMVAECELGYFEANATKYLSRFNKKGTPLQDLDKAVSYMEKALALYKINKYFNRSRFTSSLTIRRSAIQFLLFWQDQSGITDRAHCDAIYSCCTWESELDASVAIQAIHHLRVEVERQMRPQTDAGKPAGWPLGVGAGVAPAAPIAPAVGLPCGPLGALPTGGPAVGAGVNHPAPFGYQED